MLVNVAPGEDNAGETLCSLQFAARVRGIELGPLKRNVESGPELKELRDEVQRLRLEVMQASTIEDLLSKSPCVQCKRQQQILLPGTIFSVYLYTE